MLRWTRSFFVRGTLLVLLAEALIVGGVLLAGLQLAKAEISRADEEVSETMFEDMLAIDEVSNDLTLDEVVASRASHIGTDDVFLLVDRDGMFIAGNLAAWPVDLAAGHVSAELSVTPAGQPGPREYQVFAATLDNGSRLLVGHALDRSKRALAALGKALLLAALLGLPLAISAAWLVVKIVDSRLRNVEEALEAFDYQDMSQRIMLNGSRDTFDRLGAIANAMLDRMAALVAELRLITDSLAHDLRSPLSRLQNRLAEVHDSDDIDDHRAANEGAAADLDHVLTILAQMLEIGRAEAGVGCDAFVRVDLGKLVCDLAEIYGPVAEDADRNLTAQFTGKYLIDGQPDLLARALSNLMENALAYGKGAITVSLIRTPTALEIAVVDEGEGIPEDRHADAMRRFGRLDAARSTGGSGLGLSLASAVAHLHGGQLHFARREGRFAVVVSLPNLGRKGSQTAG